MMRKTKLYGVVAALLCLLTAGLSSCVQEEFVSPAGKDLRTVEFSIQVAGLSNKVLSRANSARTDLSRIEQVQVFLAKGDEIVARYMYPGTTVDETAYGSTGFITGGPTLPVQPEDGITTGIKFRIGSGDMSKYGVTHLYVVANYMDAESKLIQVPDEVTTVEALKNLEQGGAAEDINKCTLFGELDIRNTQPESSTTEQRFFKVSLKRTVAMITLAIDGSKLFDGIIITPKNVKLVNVPMRCKIGEDNKVVEVEEVNDSPFSIPGLDKAWGGTCNERMCTPLIGNKSVPVDFDPHGADDLVVPLYMFENKQGIKSISTPSQPGKDQTGKTEPPIAGCGSYIEVEAEYYYTSQVDGGNPPQINNVLFLTGTITYRFYLGNNITNDFNVDRNKHYQLTLSLNGWGGLVEDGRIRNNEFVTGGTGDVSWRVDTDLNTGGGGGDGHTLDIPANGSRLDIRLVGEIYDKAVNGGGGYHIKYETTGLANMVWAQLTTNVWTVNPSTANLSDLMFKNSDGSYSLHIYVKPYGQTEMDAIMNNVDDPLNTVQKWTDNGFREHKFSLTKGGDILDTYTIRQWLPMPVMKKEDGSKISDPRDADLYFSRFDIYDGELLQWCPDDMQTANLKDDGGTLITAANILRIKSYSPNNPPTDGTVPNEPNVDYNYKIGFHTTTAFFVTDKQNNFAHINFNNGHPNTMMEFAFFAAANSELPVDKKGMFFQSAGEVTLLSHYGLATRTAWSRIEADGVADPRWPLIPGKAYWTSTIAQEEGDGDTSGTKSMVYIFGRGKEGAKPMDRSMKFPGRMVYRKTDYAFPDLDAVTAKQ